jgi:hypothetical protein
MENVTGKYIVMPMSKTKASPTVSPTITGNFSGLSNYWRGSTMKLDAFEPLVTCYSTIVIDFVAPSDKAKGIPSVFLHVNTFTV